MNDSAKQPNGDRLPAARLDDKTCLITGATGGIGLVTAAELARRGAHLVLVGRNRERCDLARATVLAAAPAAIIEVICADLSLQGEVRRAAAEFTAKHDRLDLLINNAGAIFSLYGETSEGIERTLAINHLAPFLLTNLLLPALRRAAPARVLVVASSAHADAKAFDFNDPHARNRVGLLGNYPRTEAASLAYALAMPWAHPGFLQYARTKLANLLFTHEAARRFEGSGLTVNAVHPGLVATGFGSGNGAYGWFMTTFLNIFGVDSEKGARPLIEVAASPDYANTTGTYTVPAGRAQSSPASHDRAAQARLWELSTLLTGLA